LKATCFLNHCTYLVRNWLQNSTGFQNSLFRIKRIGNVTTRDAGNAKREAEGSGREADDAKRNAERERREGEEAKRRAEAGLHSLPGVRVVTTWVSIS
jgi:hypothetical protein